MRTAKLLVIILSGLQLLLLACDKKNKSDRQTNDLMVRMAEIEIEPAFRQQYLEILRLEAEESMRIEPGVIAIFPMHEQDNTNMIRILEIYASKDAYEAHLQTPHFKHYKTMTRNMVRTLKLVEMEAVDEKSISKIFKKAGIE